MNDYVAISNTPFESVMWPSSHSSPAPAWSGSECSGDVSSYDDILNNDWDFMMDSTALLQTVNTNMAYPDMPTMNLQLSDIPFDSTPSPNAMLDQPMQSIERTVSPPSEAPTSDDRSQERRERRRIQNRHSQRQYRARKEGLLKEYSQRIAELEKENKKYRTANQDLTKIVQSLRKNQDRANSTLMTQRTCSS